MGALFLVVVPSKGLAEASAPAPLQLPAQTSPEAAWWRASMETRDQRLSWWREARFGMFIHWGVYSRLGNEYKGRRGAGYAEHIQRVLKIPISEYRAEVAANFNPVNFNADDWVRHAKEAGMGYLIITAKHHDGFAMWPSKVGDYDIADATPFKRDPMQELREACRKSGIRFGFYYSHAFDWGEKDGPGNDWDYDNPGGDKMIGGREWWKPTGDTGPIDASAADANTLATTQKTGTTGRADFLPAARQYVTTKAIPQLQELIRRYEPDIIWFDTPHKLPPSENFRIMQAVREAGPHLVINGRLLRGWGDYESTADRPAEFSPHAGDWEGIPTTNESYGWSKFDRSHKSVAHFVQTLAKCAARGGNMLLNIGPMGDGSFDPEDTAILEGIGSWWKINGEAIKGTERTPLQVQAWGESTRKGNQLYLHVFQWPTNSKLIIGGLTTEVNAVELLTTHGRVALRATHLNRFDLAVEVPSTAPNSIDAVVLVTCASEPGTDSVRLLQPAFPSNILRAFDGAIGGGVRFGPGKKTDDYVLNWSDLKGSVSWEVRANEAASYEVSLNYDAPPGTGGNRFAVTVAGQTLEGEVKEGNRQVNSLGRVTMPAGQNSIKVLARDIKGGELFRLRHLELKTITSK